MVLIIRPFNVGDVVEIDDQVYKVARIFTLTTEAYRTDGRLFILPNFALQQNKLCNRTRSRPYTVAFSLRLSLDVRTEQILDFQRALTKWLADDPLTWAEPAIFLGEVDGDGKCAIPTILHLRYAYASLLAGWNLRFRCR